MGQCALAGWAVRGSTQGSLNQICDYDCWKDDEVTLKKNLKKENLPPNPSVLT